MGQHSAPPCFLNCMVGRDGPSRRVSSRHVIEFVGATGPSRPTSFHTLSRFVFSLLFVDLGQIVRYHLSQWILCIKMLMRLAVRFEGQVLSFDEPFLRDEQLTQPNFRQANGGVISGWL